MKKFKLFTAAFLLAVVAVATNAQVCPDCPALDDRDVVNMSSLMGASYLNDDNTLLTCDNLYILDTRVYVGPGQTLTILPGVVIQAELVAVGADANAVVVCRDGKIYANGSAECPIILTEDEDELNPSAPHPISVKEQWGGVIILGRAHNNVCNDDGNPESPTALIGIARGLGSIEGVLSADPRHWYGADITGELGTAETWDDDDNSGVLKYVSIRHGGSQIGDANEINGLTLGSVGRGTTLQNIEIVSNGDDGIEFFGGSVDLKYASIQTVEDDGLDWDQGYDGRIQFAVIVNNPTTTGDENVSYGDNGLECDGDDGADNPAWDPGCIRDPRSNPTVYNVTVIGPGAANGDKGLELKANTDGTIHNSIVACYDISVNYVTGSTITVGNNVFVGTVTTPCGGDATACPIVQANNDFVASLSGLSACGSLSIDITGGVMTVNQGFDAVPDAVPLVTGNLATYPSDGFFEAVGYKGAFEPGVDPWNDWTYNKVIGADVSAVDCPADLNGDAQVNASDIGKLLETIGSSCQ